MLLLDSFGEDRVLIEGNNLVIDVMESYDQIVIVPKRRIRGIVKEIMRDVTVMKGKSFEREDISHIKISYDEIDGVKGFKSNISVPYDEYLYGEIIEWIKED